MLESKLFLSYSNTELFLANKFTLINLLIKGSFLVWYPFMQNVVAFEIAPGASPNEARTHLRYISGWRLRNFSVEFFPM